MLTQNDQRLTILKQRKIKPKSDLNYNKQLSYQGGSYGQPWKTETVIQHFIIIIIERKDLGGVMSKDCKDTLQTLKTETKHQCDAK